MPQRIQSHTKDYNNYDSYKKRQKRPNFQDTEVSSVESDNPGALEKFIKKPEFIEVLKKKGVKRLFPIQYKTYWNIYQGYDLVARDRTGSGKTLAFTLPILEKLRLVKLKHDFPKFLVILPTRELAIQVQKQIQSLKSSNDNFISLVIYGKSSISENIDSLRKGVDILVATPGRLNDLIQRNEVKLDKLQVLCLDEADQILKQGFKEQIEKVFKKITQVNSEKVQILLFSATVPQWLQDLSYQYQDQNRKYINLIENQDIRTSTTIKHYSYNITGKEESQVIKVLENLKNKFAGEEGRILIFCQRKIDVNKISRALSFKNQPLHGDVTQRSREKTYDNFKKGYLKCIVATNVAARGLDFPSIDLVIQMQPPKNTEDYIHKAGRTGRAGKSGCCVTLFERYTSRQIFNIMDHAKIKIQELHADNFLGNHNNNGRRERQQSMQKNYQQKQDKKDFKNNDQKPFRKNYDNNRQKRNNYERDRNQKPSESQRKNGDARQQNFSGDRSVSEKSFNKSKSPQKRNQKSKPQDEFDY